MACHPHSKSNMENLKEALKTDWRKDKTTKYIYPQLPKRTGDVTTEDCDDVEGINTILPSSTERMARPQVPQVPESDWYPVGTSGYH